MLLNIFSDILNMVNSWNSDLIPMILSVIGAVAFFIVGGLLIKWAFGGKKDNKTKSEKVFETTAFLGSKAPWGMIVDKDRHEDPSKKKE